VTLYSQRLGTLKKEFSEMLKKQRGKYSFTVNQQKVYDFVIGKSTIAQFDINGEQYFLKRGNSKQGFEHILLGHYCQGCKGQITARDILNIANIIKNGRCLTDIELKNGNIGYAQKKNEFTYKIILNRERNGNWVISMFSNKEERSDCS
jgi:hypothetical protein